MTFMAGTNGGNPVTHFGKQVQKERLRRGWSLRELAKHSGIAAPHLSRIENGRRPPTENVAIAMDATFPERNGWFLEFYDESKSWAAAGFRDWREHEDRAVRLCVWQPGIIDGLLQTEDYARALLETLPGVTAEVLERRLQSRMERQHRVLLRDDDPPRAWFVTDELSLLREVGSAAIMAGQVRRLAEVAAMPTVTLQVLPAVAHCANASNLIIAGDAAAYCEHMGGGYVFTDDESIAELAVRFDTLRSESYRASDTVALLERLEKTWTTGGSRVIRTPTAGLA
jgi:transcriptional regulator with XRE-family HTH domain